MSKTAEKMRAEARAYRDLYKHLNGVMLTEAIEQVAVALERSADELEAEENAVA